jgi:hypothetical protein
MSAGQEAGPASPLAGRWPVSRWPVARWLSGQRALLGTTISLLATTMVTTVLGLAFWWVAARMLPLSQVGYGSAAVSALTLVGTFGMAGMNTVLIGYLARSPEHANGLLTAAMYACGLISALLASGFWLVTAVMLPSAAPYLHSGTEAVTFIAGSALTGATLVLDQALLGTIGGRLQLWRNTAFAVAKLVALAGLAAAWHDQFGTSILGGGHGAVARAGRRAAETARDAARRPAGMAGAARARAGHRQQHLAEQHASGASARDADARHRHAVGR